MAHFRIEFDAVVLIVMGVHMLTDHVDIFSGMDVDLLQFILLLATCGSKKLKQ